jgi:hypothetical protein
VKTNDAFQALRTLLAVSLPLALFWLRTLACPWAPRYQTFTLSLHLGHCFLDLGLLLADVLIALLNLFLKALSKLTLRLPGFFGALYDAAELIEEPVTSVFPLAGRQGVKEIGLLAYIEVLLNMKEAFNERLL